MAAEMTCSAGIRIVEYRAALNELPKAWHRFGTLCTHKIYRSGVLFYDGAAHIAPTRPNMPFCSNMQPHKRHDSCPGIPDPIRGRFAADRHHE